MSGLLQTLAYLFRILSIESPASLGPYAAWFVLILVCEKLPDIRVSIADSRRLRQSGTTHLYT